MFQGTQSSNDPPVHLRIRLVDLKEDQGQARRIPSIPGLHPPDASGCDNQRCLQALPHVPGVRGGGEGVHSHSWIRTTAHRLSEL